MQLIITRGDLLKTPAQAIVNPWNRNIIPWRLLILTGVSRAILKQAGPEPFQELARLGPLALGQAALTGPGRLPRQHIIHVAGIDMLWRASTRSISDSAKNAVALAAQAGLHELAMPLIGAGAGGGQARASQAIIEQALQDVDFDGAVRLVLYDEPRARPRGRGDARDGAAGTP